MLNNYFFTSESVSEGHPDKIADQISDAILDAVLSQDPLGRVACETMVKSNQVIVAGELTTSASLDIESIVRETIRGIGYTDPLLGFEADSCAITLALTRQSPDIAQGVDQRELGAGDQGLMFGYACQETPEYMPAAIFYAHRLVQRQALLRKDNEMLGLLPDAKSQISLEYQAGKPVRVDTIVLSTQHRAEISMQTLKEVVMELIIKPVLPSAWLDNNTRYFINPTGRFVIGGPLGDTGLTGRKIIVDTYGGAARHGGGCFSGKDPSKVDRSGAYLARKIAKTIVAAGYAERCEVQLAYTIGMPEPTSIYMNTFGSNKIKESELVRMVQQVLPLKVADVISELKLLRPIYQKTASYGHFGRKEENFTWEALDWVDIFHKAA